MQCRVTLPSEDTCLKAKRSPDKVLSIMPPRGKGKRPLQRGKRKGAPNRFVFFSFGFAGRGVDSMGVDRTKVSCTSSPHLQLGYYFKIVESNMKPQS